MGTPNIFPFGPYLRLSVTTTYTRALLASANNTVFLTALGQIASTFVNHTQNGVGAIARALNVIIGEIVTPEDYGAVGDGVAYDEVALQRALNSLKYVRGVPGKTYLCRKTTGQEYAIQYRNGMSWFGNGSTVKLANSQQPCSLFEAQYAIAGSASVEHVFLAGIFDGNTQNQGTIVISGNWFKPTLYMDGCANSRFGDITVLNGHITGFRCQGTTYTHDNKFGNIRIYGCRGTGVSIGGSAWQGNNIDAENTEHDPLLVAELQGNGIIIDASNSQFGNLSVKNCGWGIKIQNGGARVQVNNIRNTAGVLTMPDPAVKLQGGSSAHNTNISINSIITSGHNANGLYIVYSDGVHIGSYMGLDNGLTAGSLTAVERAEIRVLDSTNININGWEATPGLIGVVVDGASDNVNIGNANLLNVPAGFFWAYYLIPTTTNGAKINLGATNIKPAAAATAWARAFIQSGSGNVICNAGPINVDGLYSNWTAAGQPFLVEPATGRITTGPITFRTNQVNAKITLAAAATQTNVAAEIACSGASFGPILQIIPGNAAAITLGGPYFYGIKDVAAGGGYRIFSPNTGATGAQVSVIHIGYEAPFTGLAI